MVPISSLGAGARRCRRVAASLLLLLAASTAMATPCGSTFNPPPALKPALPPMKPFIPSDAATDCAMWQAFIYLNWPALKGTRGQPDPNASFGAPGPTVWETFKTFDEVYLPGGKPPPPWTDTALARSRLLARGVALPAARDLPTQRLLQSTRKAFRRPNPGEPQFDEIHQVDKGVLYDQASRPVYYEMLMNKVSFDYVVGHRLYDADLQYAYASATGIVLPVGAVEIKAAWKVLTPQELEARPLRFHTVQALLPGKSMPATMGLVGLHVFMMPSLNFRQGFWATFQQVDNAPVLNGPVAGAYSFFDPACAASACPPNQPSSSPKPTQVVQVAPSSATAKIVNDFVKELVVKGNADSPWQFYLLIATQWPTSSTRFGTPGQPSNEPPVPNGTPSVSTLVNPTLETFLQRPGVSCIGCHSGAAAAGAGSGRPALQSSLSFLFGHASSAASAASSASSERRR
ncbi:hypothetical protein [Mitsuaria sp. GD03876]|uniref:hypothetical protein n=1 Tax=Mitsuaria sp. GD03876 TaxID=2975399 RepID=UPI00244818AA|nr:hypothetical protein [Mitsuaria sp. GD03876]MDH0865650.1 hypothetical protein [Mitsuaria sp. GD03876]